MFLSPEEMPQTEEWFTDTLVWKETYHPRISNKSLKVTHEGIAVCAAHHPVVIMSEVAAFHHLVKQETATTLVSRKKQKLVIHTEHILQHPCHAHGYATHSTPIYIIYSLFGVTVKRFAFQEVVIVYKLPQADTFVKQMVIYMTELEHDVEFPSGHLEAFYIIIGKTRSGSIGEEPLQTHVVHWIEKPGRTVMDFYRNIPNGNEINMMV